MTSGERGVEWHRFPFALRRLPDGVRFRQRCRRLVDHPCPQADQCPQAQLNQATDHLDARWTYTHHPRTKANLRAIKYSNAMGFTVNVSTENRDDAAMLATKGLPVTCVVPEHANPNGKHLGVKFVQCPANDGSPSL